jgi:hypothetical protein
MALSSHRIGYKVALLTGRAMNINAANSLQRRWKNRPITRY